jgi:glucose/arabinose dehydrogenase
MKYKGSKLMKIFGASFLIILAGLLLYCKSMKDPQVNGSDNGLPSPFATKSSRNFCDVIGWKDGAAPKAPAGFKVTKYTDGFENPRWMYVTPNGDVLVAETNANYSALQKFLAPLVGADKSDSMKHSADRITILRDTDGNGTPDVREIFLSGLNQPFGMLIQNGWFYVANTNTLMRYPYKAGDTKITGTGEKIVDLQAGKFNRHWARNIVANSDGSKIFISVGSGSNVAETGIANEIMRANILEINPDGTGLRIYASGMRNPIGMDWAPGTNTLWTVVNERDELGDELVPDYFTSVTENGFYGWPYMYWGNHKDPRVKDTDPLLASNTIIPDVNLGSHRAPLGLVFYNKNSFPEKYRGGAFIAQHGSWNRSVLAGYNVIFISFKNGKPSGAPEEFLKGFIIDPNKKQVHGRPVDVIVMPDGSMLLTDDKSNTIWRITYSGSN